MTDATPLYSGLITDLNAVPAVKHGPYDNGGALRQAVGTLTLTAAQVTAAAVGDVWAMVRVPTRARIESIFLYSDKLDSNVTPTITSDLGVYTVGTPGTAVDSGTTWKSAATTFQAAVTGVDQTLAIVAAEIGMPLWQLADQTSDPGGFYDIAFTIEHVAATGAAGSVTLIVTYVDGD